PIAAFIQKGKLRSDLFLGLAGFFLIIPPILGVQAILTQYVEYKHSTQQLLVQNASLFTIVATWFAAVVMAPISEEIFFRGVLQGFLHRLIPESNATPEEKLNGGWSSLNLGSDSIPLTRANPNVNKRTQSLPAGSLLSDNSFLSPENRGPKSHPVVIPRMKPLRLSSYWPILVSALLFAFAHFGQGPAPIPLFLLGLGLGYIFLQTGSILPCIVIHMALNGFSMFWFTLNVILSEPDSVSEEVITTLCHDQVILFARWFF
ncbi:MAG: CPBP family intramembrane glutamic endopeptidase, partial [Planctomycetota bacterium]